MKWFQDCKTLDEIKAVYRKLAFEFHPDTGGSTAMMQALNTEYAYATARMVNGANLSQEETEKEMRFSEEYRAIIEQIVHLPGIVIELVGMWLWVTGNTKPVHKELKAAHLFYATKKKAWYYRSEQYRVKRGGKKSLDEIRSKYGSEIIREQQKPYTPLHQ